MCLSVANVFYDVDKVEDKVQSSAPPMLLYFAHRAAEESSCVTACLMRLNVLCLSSQSLLLLVIPSNKSTS